MKVFSIGFSMPNLAEFLLAFRGCLKLLRFDETGFAFFDRSAAGARRSFGIAIPIYPYFLAQIAAAAAMPSGADPLRYWVAMTIAYVFMWICFPLALLGLGTIYDWREKTVAAISVYNWMSLLTVTLHLPSLIFDFYAIWPEIAMILDYAALIYAMAIGVFVFRKLLAISTAAGVLLVIGDFFLSQLLILPLFVYLGALR